MPKRKTGDSESLSSLSEDEQPSKDVKKAKIKSSSSADNVFDEEGKIDLTGNKFVSVTDFKGRKFINIREYYFDKSAGIQKPGKKGIALNVDQWRVLKSVISALDEKTQIV